MSQENRVKRGLENLKTTDGTPYSTEPNTVPAFLTAAGVIKYDSGVTFITTTSAANYSLLEWNANQTGAVSKLKLGQKVIVKVTAPYTATIFGTPQSNLTVGATPNIVYQPNGNVMTSVAVLGPTGGSACSVTFRYIGNGKFNVVDYDIGTAGTITFT
jgi:hypothetical protein